MPNKTCPKCSTEKPESDFSNNKRNPDGLATYCRPCVGANRAAWYAANPERAKAKAALSAAWAKTDAGKALTRAASRRHYRKHRAERNEYMKVKSRGYRAAIRAALLSLMGGACIRCSFSDPRALQIDHVNGGGKQEQKALGSQHKFWKKVDASIRANLGEYQLLCANCNAIKRIENGELSGPKPGCTRWDNTGTRVGY